MDAMNMQFVKFAGRADVYRDDALDMNSAFSKVSVHTDADGILVTRQNEPDTFSQPVSVEMTSSKDIVLFAITALNYGVNDTQGAEILSRIKRYFQTSETLYVGAHTSMDEDVRSFVVDCVLRRDRKDGSYNYHHTGVTFNSLPMTQAERDCFAELVQRFVERAESGKLPQDQRKELWDTVTTNYGHYKAQAKANAKK